MTRTGCRLRERGFSEAGFTLIELGLVLLILGAMLTIAIPRLGDRSYKHLESQARKLAVTIRYMRHAAILNGRTYRLVIDLDNAEYVAAVGERDGVPKDSQSAESAGDDSGDPLGGIADRSEEEFLTDWNGPIQRVHLGEDLAFSDANLPLTTGKQFEGTTWVQFYPDGYVDVCVIHIDNGQDVFTVYVDNPIMGRVNVTPGYLEW